MFELSLEGKYLLNSAWRVSIYKFYLDYFAWFNNISSKYAWSDQEILIYPACI